MVELWTPKNEMVECYDPPPWTKLASSLLYKWSIYSFKTTRVLTFNKVDQTRTKHYTRDNHT